MNYNTNTPLQAALDYAGRGWAVFPCKPGEKRPATRNGFKDAVTDPKRIRNWWNRRSDYNVGIATGEVSGLVVLDLDPRSGGVDALAKLEADHGKLPATVTALTGGGGRHLLFKHPGGRVKSRAHALGRGLDVKADGGYIVVPPSIHPNGQPYTWANGLERDSVGVAELPGWLRNLLTDSQAVLQAYTEDSEIQQSSASPPLELSKAGSNEDCCKSCNSETLDTCSSVPLDIWGSEALCQRIEAALKSTLPTDTGQRNRAVFDLARSLKAIPELANAKARDLKHIVRRWHDAAASATSGEHTFTDTYADFVHAWTHVKYPKGKGPMDEILKRADASTSPACAGEYDPPMPRLICLCRELQRTMGDKPFYLKQVTAGELLGIDKNRAGTLLNLLCEDRVLELVYKGHTGRISEYRYIGGD